MKQQKIKSIVFVVLALFIFISCQDKKIQKSPEENLLNIFRMEQNLIDQYQENYIAYMQYQIKNFVKKNKITSETIDMINGRFNDMTEDQKREHQIKWQSKFQPVIDHIYQKTKSMIVYQTKNLDPGKMSKIQELSIKMEVLEKQTKASKLQPQFFVTPSLKSKIFRKVD